MIQEYQLCTLAQVSQEFRTLSDTPSLWTRLLKARFDYEYTVDPRERKDRVVPAKRIFKQKEITLRGYSTSHKKSLSGPAYDLQCMCIFFPLVTE